MKLCANRGSCWDRNYASYLWATLIRKILVTWFYHTSDISFIEIDGIGVVEKVAIGMPSVIIGLVVLFCLYYWIAFAAAVLLIPAYFTYRWLATTQDRRI